MTTLKDHTGESAWAFDMVQEAWRPCVVAGPDQGNPNWPICQVRFRDGTVATSGPLTLRFVRPTGPHVRVLPL